MLIRQRQQPAPAKSATPWQYLEYASLASLQSFELNRLNHAANLLKEIQTLLQQYLDDTAAANVARIFMQQREAFAPLKLRPQGHPNARSLLLTLPAA